MYSTAEQQQTWLVPLLRDTTQHTHYEIIHHGCRQHCLLSNALSVQVWHSRAAADVAGAAAAWPHPLLLCND
jgi:hypothetical protein